MNEITETSTTVVVSEAVAVVEVTDTSGFSVTVSGSDGPDVEVTGGQPIAVSVQRVDAQVSVLGGADVSVTVTEGIAAASSGCADDGFCGLVPGTTVLTWTDDLVTGVTHYADTAKTEVVATKALTYGVDAELLSVISTRASDGSQRTASLAWSSGFPVEVAVT